MPSLKTASGFVSAVFVLFAAVHENAAATPISPLLSLVVPQNFAKIIRSGQSGFEWINIRPGNR
jgi:hypothetical protein